MSDQEDVNIVRRKLLNRFICPLCKQERGAIDKIKRKDAGAVVGCIPCWDANSSSAARLAKGFPRGPYG